MCLIIHRATAGTLIPDALALNGITDNPDGWGIMSADNGQILTLTGLDPLAFPAALAAFGDRALTIHFRMATHGTVDELNCHPFPILGNRYALMHNGILATPCQDKSRSDTYHFAERVLAPILAHDPEAFGTPYLDDLLSSLIGSGNKLVILRSDGASMVVNRARGLDYGGLWLSNDYSLPRKEPIALDAVRPSTHFGNRSGGRLTGSRYDWENDRDSYFPDDMGEDERELTELEPIRIGTDREDTVADLWEFPDELTALSGWDDDMIELACSDYPDYVASLIRDHLDSYTFPPKAEDKAKGQR